MLELLTESAKDPILSLSVAFREDPRPNKIDLGIGVYRNNAGETPIMAAIRASQLHVAQTQSTKAYVGLAGNETFNHAMMDLLIGGTALRDRAAAMQTPGASGALRMLGELLALAKPHTTVWMSDPSYVNHAPIMRACGLNVRFFPYFDYTTKRVDGDAMLAELAQAKAGDVVLLHGCCHNPTGADLSFEHWQAITQMAQQQGFLPFVDMAYQGFGDGLEEDAAGLRWMANHVEEMVISVSCSKNFGLYRERVGAAIVAGQNVAASQIAKGRLQELSRASYTMPPDFGATLVADVLTDEILRAQWQQELAAMHERILTMRQQLAAALRVASDSTAFDYIESHKGMFSMTAMTGAQIARLRDEFAIFVVPGGRINVAGMRESDVPVVAQAIATVTR